MKKVIIFAMEKLGKFTAGSFLHPHEKSFVFANNFFFRFSCFMNEMLTENDVKP